MDHDPVIWELCPRCKGTGKVPRYPTGDVSLVMHVTPELDDVYLQEVSKGNHSIRLTISEFERVLDWWQGLKERIVGHGKF
jgi:hypothetical protein